MLVAIGFNLGAALKCGIHIRHKLSNKRHRQIVSAFPPLDEPAKRVSLSCAGACYDQLFLRRRV